MRTRILLCICTLALLFAGCNKDDTPRPRKDTEFSFNDTEYMLDGLVKKVGEDYVPMYGILQEDGMLHIPATSAADIEQFFRSLTSPEAHIQERGNTLVWSMTDEKGHSQGDAVLTLEGEGQSVMARVTLPGDFPVVKGIEFMDAGEDNFSEVDPKVREELEDYYYYGAIVDIPDYGCGSGKYVVFRPYNFETGENGMAVRLDDHRWSTSEFNYGDNAAKVVGRSSCLSTLQTAGQIFRSDQDILSKQLRNAGCTALYQHYFTDSRSWTGMHYYYCLHDGEYDTIGPFTDTEFYECWVYWFLPDGDHIRFW